jgi:hypothetical protein
MTKKWGNELKRVSAQVDSEQMESGEIVPIRITWQDGRVWNIDRVIHSCASPDGEYEGIRYTVFIGSAERYIYRAGHAWYVMA